MAQWPRYPPCASNACSDAACCGLGHKFRWEGLLGRKAEEAKAKIESDNPSVTVVVLPPGRVGNIDFCCNRVYLLVNESGNVSAIPVVG